VLQRRAVFKQEVDLYDLVFLVPSQVGLRWWNYIDDSGESVWKFESREAIDRNASLIAAPSGSSKSEATVFWAGLVLAPAMWVILFVVALTKFNLQWMVLVVIGLTLTTSNLLGYIRLDRAT
jgi:hypothetical protein